MKNLLKGTVAKTKSYLSDGGLLWFLSDKQLIYLSYFLVFYKFPDLNNPKTFNEKMQWFKLYGGFEKYLKYVDKFLVRDYIKRKIGSNYLVPIFGKWDRFEDIPFEALPGQFVLKVTHGSGYVFICKDKKSLDIPNLKKTVSRWMNENFYKKTRE